MSARYQSAEWMEFSGLPAALNAVRAGGWSVFKKIVELDCARHRDPEAVEITLAELGERCGLPSDKTAKIVEALVKRKYLRAFVPEHEDEAGLFMVNIPVATPTAPEEVARDAADPNLRNPRAYRYLKPPPEPEEHERLVQRVADAYLNTLSHRINSFIVDEIDILVRRFPVEEIEQTMERAADLEIRSLGWVAKDLIRQHKPKKKKAPDA